MARQRFLSRIRLDPELSSRFPYRSALLFRFWDCRSRGQPRQSVPTFSRLPRESSLPREQWGGRRHSDWSREEEASFLAPFLDEAKKGGILVVPAILRALEEKLGRPVPPSTVYRMLHRHGWRRKTAPDKRQAHQGRSRDSGRF
ncbi:MAG: winged helix-turn-helix domain-containing protein [Leptospirillum sp.]